ncbi:tripartite tricarboxylate transporter substrate binding protein [Roseateles sp.]|uniref:tripartite tricarboxylate transporter substrate binding protein n=1 Tax=Roseateles sp. TaxID=1971397 RepID=UPI0031D96486
MTLRTDRRRVLLAGAASLSAAALPRLARASAAYPGERAITFICPWPAGGTADVTMRALCLAASKALGQTVIIENRAGASGMLGTKVLSQAKPDGYTIGQIPISVTRFAQLRTVQLDPLKDLTYLARVNGQTFGLAVRAESPWKTLAEFVAAAKAKPGLITYGSAGIGGATHVGMEEFNLLAGIQLNHIPYKGGAPALQDLLGGQVDAVADSSSWAPHVKSGKLRLLATWGETRTKDFPGVPTLKESGYDLVVDAPNGIGAPKGMDPAIVARLRDAFRKAAADPDFIATCDRIDSPVMYLDQPDYEKYVQATYRKDTQLIERLKLRELLAKG